MINNEKVSDYNKSYMISTSDNPFNPFKDFKSWFVWDETNGYHTCSLLARLSEIVEDMGDREELLSYYDAAEKILMYNPTGNYIKVYEDE